MITIIFFFCLIFLGITLLNLSVMTNKGSIDHILELLPMLIDIILWTWLFYLLVVKK